MRKRLIILLILPLSAFLCSSWGFFAHKRINYLAVFTLPPEMVGFYKHNIAFLVETSTDPDQRRYAVEGEAPRHYIDIDRYGDSAAWRLPLVWDSAVARYSADTLMAYGIVPWHIQTMYYRLREAFLLRDPRAILRVSSELGHYIGDANVPLHTTENYNGQLTGQHGIHGFWESRLPELFSDEYDFLVGRAEYVSDPAKVAWEAVRTAHMQVDSVLRLERELNEEAGNEKYVFETRGRTTVRTYSSTYSKAYHDRLHGMVERQMRRSVKMVGDFWYSAWVDAGKPDLEALIGYTPSEEELEARRRELAEWRESRYEGRGHEE